MPAGTSEGSSSVTQVLKIFSGNGVKVSIDIVVGKTEICQPLAAVLLKFFENAVKRDGVGGDCAGIGSGGELREGACGRALLKDFHFVCV